MKLIGNTIYNDEAAPADIGAFGAAARPSPAGGFHSAYRSPSAKGLGELTHSSYRRLRSRVMRGIAKNIALSALMIAALIAVAALAFGIARRYEGMDMLFAAAVPVLCFGAMIYVAVGAYNDTRADLARLRREKKRLSRTAAARMERESGRRTLSALLTLAAAAALLAALNMLPLA